MRIDRVVVEGGFLDGLDLRLDPGLNVLIGARGTGKTSIIELIRYCLNASALTDLALQEGNAQATATLGDGRVTVHLSAGSHHSTITRAVGESGQDSPESISILAQNEVEAIGVQPSGRLRLIDQFLALDGYMAPIDSSKARASSLTSEIQGLLGEIDTLQERAVQLTPVQEQLDRAVTEQTLALESMAATTAQRENLERLQQATTTLSSQQHAQQQILLQLTDLKSQLLSATATPLQRKDTAPSQLGSDAASTSELLDRLASIDVAVATLLAEIDASTDAVRVLLGETQGRVDQVNERARELRLELEELQQGAGDAARRVQHLREQASQLTAVEASIVDRAARLHSLTVQRDNAYDELESARNNVSIARRDVVSKLNQELGPEIRIELLQSGNSAKYLLELTSILRGSGLQYNRLAEQLVDQIAPLELVKAVDSHNVKAIADAAGLPQQRVDAMLRHMRRTSLANLATVEVDDFVRLELLDGHEYKPTTKLSIGQRCTTVIPILLARPSGVLIVDQPEDHLDNAFVAGTLVSSLRDRQSMEGGQQIIFSSHNPNIPVLGNADLVAVMVSDGRRAQCVHQGGLDHPRTVEHVSSLMEGGADAFRRRAEFYGQQP